MVGTVGANYDIKWSKLSTPNPGFALEKVQITAGQWVNIGATFCVSNRIRAAHTRKGGYEQSLDKLGEKFVILHDVKTRQAWLVDGLSALLHLVRACLYRTYNSRYLKCLSKPGELLSEGTGSGRMMAFETLTSEHNMMLPMHKNLDQVYDPTRPNDHKKTINLVDTVKNIMHILEQILDHQADTRADQVGIRISRSPWSQLEGFDLMDIAAQDDIILPKAIEVMEDGEVWSTLTRKINAITLFGQDFGELLMPIRPSGDANYCKNCSWNINMPSGKDLLAVSLSEFEELVTRRGEKFESCWRLVDKLYHPVSPQLFSSCYPVGRESCRQARIQRVRAQASPTQEESTNEITKPRGLKRLKIRINKHLEIPGSVINETRVSTTSAIDFDDGAVLIGMSSNRLQKRLRPTKESRRQGKLPQPGGPKTSFQPAYSNSPLPSSTRSAKLQPEIAVASSRSSNSQASTRGTKTTSRSSTDDLGVDHSTAATSVAGKDPVDDSIPNLRFEDMTISPAIDKASTQRLGNVAPGISFGRKRKADYLVDGHAEKNEDGLPPDNAQPPDSLSRTGIGHTNMEDQ